MENAASWAISSRIRFAGCAVSGSAFLAGFGEESGILLGHFRAVTVRTLDLDVVMLRHTEYHRKKHLAFFAVVFVRWHRLLPFSSLQRSLPA
jgi:hypothetical protein